MGLGLDLGLLRGPLGGHRGDRLGPARGGERLEAGQGAIPGAAGLQTDGHQGARGLRVLVLMIGGLVGATVRVGGVPAGGTPHRQRRYVGETGAAARRGPVENRSTRVVHGSGLTS